jgi:hypothetical protein
VKHTPQEIALAFNGSYVATALRIALPNLSSNLGTTIGFTEKIVVQECIKGFASTNLGITLDNEQAGAVFDEYIY